MPCGSPVALRLRLPRRLLFRHSRRGDRLCVPAAGALRAQVLHELPATPLSGTGRVWLVPPPDLRDRYRRDGSSQLRRVGVPRRGADRGKAELTPPGAGGTCSSQWGTRCFAGHVAYAPPVALAALPGWMGPRAHGAQTTASIYPRRGATASGWPGRCARARGAGAAQVQDALRRLRPGNGRPYVLVRWTGLEAAGDTWEPLDNLINCEAAIAAFERATVTGVHSRPAPPPPPLAGAASAPPPIPPTGFTVEAVPPGDLGVALVGRTVLYWWPDDGWQRGAVARLCKHGAFSHVVAYTRQKSALPGTANMLLDAASYSSRWVILSPAADPLARPHIPQV